MLIKLIILLPQAPVVPSTIFMMFICKTIINIQNFKTFSMKGAEVRKFSSRA